jgi:epoxyqueuosine reductase
MNTRPTLHILRDLERNLDSRYTILSTSHLGDLRAKFERLLLDDRLSTNPVFRGYLSDIDFHPPHEMPQPRAIIVLAAFVPPQQVDFHYRGRVVTAFLPSGYYRPDFTRSQIQTLIMQEVVKDPGYSILPADNLPMKMLAARSGLGKYGRNNICYVEELGSFISLQAFFTDCPLDAGGWHKAELMNACHKCKACIRQCPMNCISEKKFIVDVGRCITLYNEGESEFPDWMPGQVHHALVGCMKCQLFCPANREAAKKIGRLDPVSEQETEKILTGEPDAELTKSLTRKLKGFPLATSPEMFPLLRRNVKAFIRPN